jgi:predicted GIY-YIG superfamily endonuclease
MDSTPGFVYFVQGVDGGPIKIGFTTDVRRRLITIQAYSPISLRLVALFSGRAEHEGKLHRMFQAERLHGEWFFPSPELLAIVRTHADLENVYLAEDLTTWGQATDRRFSPHRSKKAQGAERQRPFRAGWWGVPSGV